MKKSIMLLATAYLILNPVFAIEKPASCPSLLLLKSANWQYVDREPLGNRWGAVLFITDLGYKWQIGLGGIDGKNHAEAFQNANLIKSNTVWTKMPQAIFDEWFCDYHQGDATLIAKTVTLNNS